MNYGYAWRACVTHNATLCTPALVRETVWYSVMVRQNCGNKGENSAQIWALKSGYDFFHTTRNPWLIQYWIYYDTKINSAVIKHPLGTFILHWGDHCWSIFFGTQIFWKIRLHNLKFQPNCWLSGIAPPFVKLGKLICIFSLLLGKPMQSIYRNV